MVSGYASFSEHLDTDLWINDLDVERELIARLGTEEGYVNNVVDWGLIHITPPVAPGHRPSILYGMAAQFGKIPGAVQSETLADRYTVVLVHAVHRQLLGVGWRSPLAFRRPFAAFG